MSKILKGKTVRLRWVKNYKEASVHVAIGKVMEENFKYILLEGRTFHFRSLLNLNGSNKGIRVGDVGLRVIPWSVIEVLHILPKGCDYGKHDVMFDNDGNLILNDKQKTIIAFHQTQ